MIWGSMGRNWHFLEALLPVLGDGELGQLLELITCSFYTLFCSLAESLYGVLSSTPKNYRITNR